MARLFQLPKQVPIVSGAVSPGAKANFYLTGTTTPTDTYTDDALTTPHTNPVVADANGVFDAIYLDPDVDYKLTLNDADDNLIYTVDPVMDALTAAQLGKILYPQSSFESSAGITPSDYSYPWGDVRRYGATGDGVSDDSAAFQSAFNSGHRVWMPTPASFYNFASGLTVPDGLYVDSENPDILLSFSGSAGEWLFTGTRITREVGAIIGGFKIESATNGVNGFKFIECRSVHLHDVKIVSDSGGDDFAIGILFDDDAASSPQVGTAWNEVQDIYIENCSTVGLRLDTQGTLAWCNRNTFKAVHLENCAIGLDIDRGDTNHFFGLNTQNCTISVQLQAGADYNFIYGNEEASVTTALSIASGAVHNQIVGVYDITKITDNGTESWLAVPNFWKIPPLVQNGLTFEPASGHATLGMAVDNKGNLNLSVRDNAASPDNAVQVVQLIGNQADPYANVIALRSTEFFKLPVYTSAELADIADDVNTSDRKEDGMAVWETTNNKVKIATGSADNSTWVDADGTNAVTPA